ncbi:MAG TPA: hypothetical protein VFD01_09245 [Candidatus Dormibacteraeota bacterium]|nr:hypothetical protein [Candidatus Dormibacteraeota bacterium]
MAIPGRNRVARDGQNVALVHDLLRAAILRGDPAPGATTCEVAPAPTRA